MPRSLLRIQRGNDRDEYGLPVADREDAVEEVRKVERIVRCQESDSHRTPQAARTLSKRPNRCLSSRRRDVAYQGAAPQTLGAQMTGRDDAAEVVELPRFNSYGCR